MSVDPPSAFGDRVAARLRDDRLIWLTTVTPSGAPSPVPVWFLWDGGDSVLIYSKPESPKLRNIAENPRVALHLETHGAMDENIVLYGTAEMANDPPIDRVPEYVARYADDIAGFGWTPESMAADYSVPLRVTIRRSRSH
jgi:PPOX class probable F420-dependent enzyme